MPSATENSVTVAVVSRRGRPRRQYTCGYCAKAFKRSEHCVRHERTHTQEKPFVCRYCGKSYSRKDLVTRHERTLHAHAHQQHQQQHQQQPEQADNQANAASAAPARPTALRTSPGDELEADQEPDTQSGKDLSPRDPLSPRNGVAFSLSPSSSSSSNLMTADGRCASLLSPAATAATDSGNIPMQHTRAPSLTAASTTRAEYPSLSAAHNSTTDAHFQPSTSQADSGSNNASPNPAPFHPPNQEGPVEMVETDIVMSMAPDVGLPQSEVMNDNDPAQHQHNHYQPQSSEPLEQDPTRFLFPVMPTLDFDLSAFSFSPMPSNPAELHHDRHLSHVTHDIRLEDLSTEEFQAFSSLNHPPSQMFIHLIPPGGSSTDLDSSNSHTNGHDLPLLRDRRQPSPSIVLDDIAYESIRNDLARRQAVPEAGVDIPPAKLCQAFLSSYITSFHDHLPIIHLHSFSPRTTPSPLLLAMCSIGALYRLDRRRARRLYDTAVRSVEIVARPSKDDSQVLFKEYCLWYAQARMLLSFYSLMSGDKDLVFDTMRGNGFYTLVYNKTRVALGGSTSDSSRISWQQWIEHESWKRLLGGLFIASTLTMVLFDVNPGFNATQDLEFEAFHDEAIWNAASSNEWREIWTSHLNQEQSQHRRTMNEVLVDIMLEGKYHPSTIPYQVSALSALVLMHGVVVHMWQRLQVSQAFAAPRGFSSFSAASCDPIGSSLLDSAMIALERCGTFLKSTGSENKSQDSQDDEVTSLVFNCQAILRIAYIRLFKPISPSNNINLISLDAAETNEAVTSFATAKMERSPQLLSAVIKCFEGLRIAVKLGHMLVRKTAAFRWSVEHAIAGWESALLVTKWIHSVEVDSWNGAHPNPNERELLIIIKDVLEDAECDLSDSVSMAAAVARTWGWLLQDVWIWGITPRMGAALDLLAKAYDRVGKANQRPSLNASTLAL